MLRDVIVPIGADLVSRSNRRCDRIPYRTYDAGRYADTADLDFDHGVAIPGRSAGSLLFSPSLTL